MSEINQLIRNFVIKNNSLFQKESNYTIENIIKKKKAIISNKNQKEKSIKLLKEIKQFLGSNGSNNQGELLMKINKDPLLFKNIEIINVLKQSPQIELNNHQTENLDLLFSTRNLIKSPMLLLILLYNTLFFNKCGSPTVYSVRTITFSQTNKSSSSLVRPS